MTLISIKMHAKNLKIKVILHFGMNKAGFLEKIKHSYSLFLPALLKYTVCLSPGLQYSGHTFLHIGSWQTFKWISSFLFHFEIIAVFSWYLELKTSTLLSSRVSGGRRKQFERKRKKRFKCLAFWKAYFTYFHLSFSCSSFTFIYTISMCVAETL